MTRIRKYLFGCITILVALAASSCVRKSAGEGAAEIVVKVDVSKSAAFDIDADASLERLVPLETTDSSLIGSLDKVLFAGDDIVVLDKKNKRILLFSGTGAFLRQIGRQGNGPAEYVEVSDLCCDKTGKMLYAFDRIKRKMFQYSLDGEDVRVIQTGFTGNSFLPARDGWWLYYSYLDNPDRWSLIHVDPEMKQISDGYFPYKDFLPTTMEPCFATGGGKDLFFYNYSNFIYELTGGKLKPYIELDFGERTLPYDRLLKAETPQEYSAAVTECKGLGNIRNVHSAGRYIFLEFSEVGFNTVGTAYFGIIDTKKHGMAVFGSFNRSEILRDQTLLGVTEADEMVFALSPAGYLEDYPAQLKAVAPELAFDDNPILAFYKLRNQGQ